MALTTVKTTALSGTITNAQLAGSIDLTAKVTGTLPIANGGTNSTSTTFVNAASNVTGTLPAANGGTGATSYTATKVLQTVSANWGAGTGTSSTSFVTTGHACNITLTDTDNRVLITLAGGAMDLPDGDTINCQVYYDYSGKGGASSVTNYGAFNKAGASSYLCPHSWSYVHNISTAEEITYTVYFKRHGGSGTVYYNNAGVGLIGLILQEVVVA